MKEYHFPFRVYFSDTDCEGIVYHTKYLDFAEHGRAEILREVIPGVKQLDMMKSGVIFVVKNINIDYRKPAYLDDMLDVVTTLEQTGHFSITFNQEVRRNGEVLCSVKVKAASVNAETKRPVPLPSYIVNAIL